MRAFALGFMHGAGWAWLVISGVCLGVGAAMWVDANQLVGAVIGFGVAAGCVSKAFFTVYGAMREGEL